MTWACKGGDNYYWGHYFRDPLEAKKDLLDRAATPAERLYAYEQSAQVAEKCGSPGYLHGGLDNTGTVFLSRWERNAVPENTLKPGRMFCVNSK